MKRKVVTLADSEEAWTTIVQLLDELADIIRDSLEKGDLRALD